MKLTVSGANMKDETAHLSSYGVHSGSIIVLEGKPPGEEEIQETASGNPEEVGLNLRIAQTVEKLKVASVPVIQKYETEVSEYIAAGTTDETKRRKLFDMSAFINEQIMQALFTLDGITCAPEFTTARQKRREGVRYAQSLLDRLDTVKADLKAYIELQKS
ncbi:hypothetical protein VKS41_005824 [Umbelopsis sp. WA50703]